MSRLQGSDQQQMLLDGLGDIDWVLDHLNKIKARNSVGEMAQHKVQIIEEKIETSRDAFF